MTVLGIRPEIVGFPVSNGQLADISVQETATGYIVRCNRRPTLRERLQRCFALGAALALTGLSLALFVASWADSDPLGWAVAVLFVAAAALLFDFGCHRSDRSFHVDLAAQELQEHARGLDGRARLRARYPFARVNGLFIDESRGIPALVLRLGHNEPVLPIAFGKRAELTPLAQRLGRDLINGRITAPNGA